MKIVFLKEKTEKLIFYISLIVITLLLIVALFYFRGSIGQNLVYAFILLYVIVVFAKLGVDSLIQRNVLISCIKLNDYEKAKEFLSKVEIVRPFTIAYRAEYQFAIGKIDDSLKTIEEIYKIFRDTGRLYITKNVLDIELILKYLNNDNSIFDSINKNKYLGIYGRLLKKFNKKQYKKLIEFLTIKKKINNDKSTYGVLELILVSDCYLNLYDMNNYNQYKEWALLSIKNNEEMEKLIKVHYQIENEKINGGE